MLVPYYPGFRNSTTESMLFSALERSFVCLEPLRICDETVRTRDRRVDSQGSGQRKQRREVLATVRKRHAEKRVFYDISKLQPSNRMVCPARHRHTSTEDRQSACVEGAWIRDKRETLCRLQVVPKCNGERTYSPTVWLGELILGAWVGPGHQGCIFCMHGPKFPKNKENQTYASVCGASCKLVAFRTHCKRQELLQAIWKEPLF